MLVSAVVTTRVEAANGRRNAQKGAARVETVKSAERQGRPARGKCKQEKEGREGRKEARG